MIGLRKYAAHRKAAGLPGGTLRAVQEAIANGRLSKSLSDDRKKIADAGLADEEWAASTKADYVPLTGPSAPTPSPTPTPGVRTPTNGLAEARARREAAQADLRELELARHRGELVPAKDFQAHLARVEERLRGVITRCRNKLLGIPTRARQRDPSLSKRHVTLIDTLVREALEDLAYTSPEHDGQHD